MSEAGETGCATTFRLVGALVSVMAAIGCALEGVESTVASIACAGGASPAEESSSAPGAESDVVSITLGLGAIGTSGAGEGAPGTVEGAALTSIGAACPASARA